MMRRQATVLAVVGVALVAACTTAPPLGSPPSQPSPTQAAETGKQPQAVELTALLNDEGCRVSGAMTLDPGPVRIEVDNQDVTDRASFQLLRIEPDGTFESFDEHLADEQARIDAGEQPLGFAGLATEMSGTLIAAGMQDQLEATLDEGNYILVCADWADGPGTDGKGRLIGAGRLIVGTPPVASPTAASTLGPAARGYAMMADLPGEPGVVPLGGATRPGPIDLSDMWTFVPEGGWREITPSSLPELSGFAPLTGNAFAFDTGRRVPDVDAAQLRLVRLLAAPEDDVFVFACECDSPGTCRGVLLRRQRASEEGPAGLGGPYVADWCGSSTTTGIVREVRSW